MSMVGQYRCPTWEEMCFVQSLFWREDECVMQLHVPQNEWVSHHPYTLHLWKPIGQMIPRPPAVMVGLKGVEITGEGLKAMDEKIAKTRKRRRRRRKQK